MKSSYRPGQTVFDAIDDFSAWDRCITRGMPVSMEPRNYNNGIRIMQSPGYVVILLEMAHEARVIPTNGLPPLDSGVKEWMGESRGHWEGNTLVVETTNFLQGYSGANPDTYKMVERITRIDANNLRRDITFDDPKTWTKPWTIRIEMGKTDDARQMIFDSACHEGNYGMVGILVGARREEAAAKK
jgi:hypothetical protein